MFKRENLILSIPFLALFIGLSGIAYTSFGTFQSQGWKDFWSGLSKTILAGGIFALLLKTYQFMGIFKEELKKVVYDAKFLANRKDLEQVWTDVSKVLFNNKFPKISEEITSNISHLYLPTHHVLYYDNYKQIIEIEIIDIDKQIVKVKQHSSFLVYPKSKTEKFIHKTTNKLHFDKDKSEVSLIIEKFLINDIPRKPLITKNIINNNTLQTSYEVTLEGQDCYSFATCIEKTYSLLNDNTVATVKDYIIHDFNLKLHLLKGGIKIDFHSVGTLKKFTPVGVVNEHYQEYEYKGLIYPKQGYLFFIKKK